MFSDKILIFGLLLFFLSQRSSFKKGCPHTYFHPWLLFQNAGVLSSRHFSRIVNDDVKKEGVRVHALQGPNESVQISSERLLSVAEDAYPQSCIVDNSSCELVQKHLLDIFCDGLFHDDLRMKVMRANSTSIAVGIAEAIHVPYRPQQILKRHNCRKNT